MLSAARTSLAAALLLLLSASTAFAIIPPEWTRKFDRTIGLTVRFGSAKLQDGIQLFNSTPEAQPRFGLTQASPQTSTSTARYTIVLVDPDYPSPKNSISPQYVHFVATDFKVTGSDKMLVTDAGHIHVPYTSPSSAGSPEAKGVHRYVFLMYAQKDELKKGSVKGVVENPKRKEFNLKEFQEANGLGEPIAGIHFLQEISANKKKRATTFWG